MLAIGDSVGVVGVSPLFGAPVGKGRTVLVGVEGMNIGAFEMTGLCVLGEGRLWSNVGARV